MTYLFTDNQEIKNDEGNPIPVSKDTSVNSSLNPIYVDANISGSAIGASLQPWGLSISQGLVAGHTFIHKFGAVPAMSQNTSGTVWDKSDTAYPWSAFNTAGTLTVLTTAANGSTVTTDNGLTFRVEGLDENYEPTYEDFTISGSTATGSVTFKRVYRAYSTNGTNTSQIRVSRGGTEVLRINIEKSQTLMAIYTVPAGKTAYLMQGIASVQYGADATGDMFVRYFGQDAFRVGHSFEVSGAGGPYNYVFQFPVAIPEKSDVDVRATVRSNNARMTAAFDVLLIDN